MAPKSLSVLSRAAKAQIKTSPYPHIIIENALDPELFDTLQSSLPPVETVMDGKAKKDTWYDYPACKVVKDNSISALWRDFFHYHTSSDFFGEILDLFGEQIHALYPDIERKLNKSLKDAIVGMRPGGRADRLAKGADVSMECQFYVNYTQHEREIRGYHIDRPSELFAALLYFRQPEDDSRGGDLLIGEAKNPDQQYPDAHSIRVDASPMEISPDKINHVDTGHYQANTLVLFINSPKSIHAVSRREATDIPRRHINFCCDLTFDLFQIRKPLRDVVRDKLEGTPIIWRLSRLF